MQQLATAWTLLVATLHFGYPLAAAEKTVLDGSMRHLRRGETPEWSNFPRVADAATRDIRFRASHQATAGTLRIRQQDVKQSWHVALNGRRLGALRIDENDMIVYFEVPAGTLRDGDNELSIAQDPRSTAVDDIRVGEIEWEPRPIEAVLHEGSIEFEVLDADNGERTPARITIVSAAGALQTVSAEPGQKLAVRPGIVYTATGMARLGLPAGRYQVWAGRGFEYSVASTDFEIVAGKRERRSLTIRREVPTAGYVACDTHVHTLTHSGHGDATIDERMITLAGEGIELPIATDHNAHIDYEPAARTAGVRRFFTPVVGNEVTTPVGHFNIFPVPPGTPVPASKLSDWKLLFAGIHRTPGVKVVILNHARDAHSGTRPFGPALHNPAVGQNLEGWVLRANAMEVVNSSATQTDVRRLFLDWMTMLNRGRILTPVGSSDSHDVGRHFVGQGRTYIRAADEHPERIDVDAVVENFLQGQVMVSYGLLAELTVDGKYRSGETAAATGDSLQVAVRVLGPAWVRSETVELYMNGEKIREQSLPPLSAPTAPAGVQWSGSWDIPRPRHDVHLVAITVGAGVDGPYWKTAKPYQPRSPDWEPHTIGCSGAVWIDADGNGRATPAYDYAERTVLACRDLPALLQALAEYDAAVAAQAAQLWSAHGESLYSSAAQAAIDQATPAVQAGFRFYLAAQRASEQARVEAKP